NNWITEDGGTGLLRDYFDVFIESAVVGLRKPDPRIYELACRELGVTPPEAVFLDDIGSNLKAARALGMATIKVDDPDTALAELQRAVGVTLACPAYCAAGASAVAVPGSSRSTRVMRGDAWPS